MSVMHKIRLSPSTLPSFLPGYDESTFVSTMSDEERSKHLVEYGNLMDQGKEQEAKKLWKRVPSDPTFLMTQLVLLGREEFLKLGFNTADAEKAYGADWLDRFDIGGGVLHYSKE